MKVVYSPAQTLHHAQELDGGQIIASWESPIRAVRVAERLAGGHQLTEPDPLDLDLVHQIHDPDYVQFLADCWDRWVSTDRAPEVQAMPFTWPAAGLRDDKIPTSLAGQLGYYSFAADCSIGPDTWTGVAVSAAAAHTAARLVVEEMAGGSPSPAAFALCRPPGHHAGAMQFGGYCYLNNAALAAQYLRNSGIDRVAIVDIDYHHGNGTQSIFYDRADVVFASIHAGRRG